eukprot:tig00000478_g1263.t1
MPSSTAFACAPLASMPSTSFAAAPCPNPLLRPLAVPSASFVRRQATPSAPALGRRPATAAPQRHAFYCAAGPGPAGDGAGPARIRVERLTLNTVNPELESLSNKLLQNMVEAQISFPTEIYLKRPRKMIGIFKMQPWNGRHLEIDGKTYKILEYTKRYKFSIRGYELAAQHVVVKSFEPETDDPPVE